MLICITYTCTHICFINTYIYTLICISYIHILVNFHGPVNLCCFPDLTVLILAVTYYMFCNASLLFFTGMISYTNTPSNGCEVRCKKRLTSGKIICIQDNKNMLKLRINNNKNQCSKLEKL